MRTLGVVLAAGEGRRMGVPKALLRTADGTSWAARAGGVLLAGGCTEVVVSVGAQAAAVRATLPAEVGALDVADWSLGQGRGIVRAIDHARFTDADALLLTLVDLPDVVAAHIEAVLANVSPDALVRAGTPGRGGHPVVLGRQHFGRARELAADGSGLKALFSGGGAQVRWVALDGSRRDVDEPGQLPTGTRWPSNP
ncbi:MAG: nucleotidyltransferase family protein [Janthinobacterium lividum]